LINLKKLVRFVILYVYATIKWLLTTDKTRPKGIEGSVMLMFSDTELSPIRHGVVVFLLNPGDKTENYSDDLFGPFGFSSSIRIGDKQLYGRDTWGTVQGKHLSDNPKLNQLVLDYPNVTIVLAGVRHLNGTFLWPLNQAQSFILVEKNQPE